MSRRRSLKFDRQRRLQLPDTEPSYVWISVVEYAFYVLYVSGAAAIAWEILRG